jgi:hypothetical protein
MRGESLAQSSRLLISVIRALSRRIKGSFLVKWISALASAKIKASLSALSWYRFLLFLIKIVDLSASSVKD